MPAAVSPRPERSLRILMLGGAMRRVHGFHVAVRGLAGALAEAGHDVTLVQSAPASARVPIPGVRLEYGRVCDKGLLTALYGLRRLRHYDIVHSHDYTGGLVGLRSLVQPLPLVASVHAARIRADRLRGANSRWRGILLSARYARRVVVPSLWLRRELVRRLALPESRIHAVPWGVAAHWHQPRPLPRRGREPLRIALVNMKGVPVALRAVAALPAAQLDLYGTHRRLESYTALAAALGIGDRVRFHGFVANEDLPQRLARAHCVLHPTPSESFGQVVAEAAALGLPVVATRVGAVPEIVHHEETGLLCPADDAKAFARALQELANDPGYAARLGRAAQRRAAHDWRWERTVRRLVRDVYAPVVSEAGARHAR